ncbi:MAG TPA: undecaprenyldiphospho-muramoylpentapeptide beta-N-acetylglucosaminyltransferase [Chloroflexia bacterium]|nr:undecaprenyldiphospho-muramoylpentapeptide beta-N-acetylglucosaminyltransferase [Chloroflexia bacterium]
MRILITGGGTGGHVSPAVAVIAALQARAQAEGWPLELRYLGSRDGVEHRVIGEIGLPYTAIQTGKLRRYFSWRTPLDLARIPVGVVQALLAVARNRPAVIFSTGGYVCVPVVVAGWLLRVPVLTHEQTARSGLANRIAARFARCVAISFPESAAEFPRGRTVLTGNPLRPGLDTGDPIRAAAHWQLDPARPTIYVTGGAQGAHAINAAVSAALPDLLGLAQIVHQVGEGPEGTRADLQTAEVQARSIPAAVAGYRPVAFVGPELGDLFALATLVIGRAGAGTVNELAALGKPAILIPLPGAASDEQTANAARLAAAGAAILLPQPECTPARLTAQVRDLLADPPTLARMAAAGPTLARPDAATKLVDLLLQLAAAR